MCLVNFPCFSESEDNISVWLFTTKFLIGHLSYTGNIPSIIDCRFQNVVWIWSNHSKKDYISCFCNVK